MNPETPPQAHLEIKQRDAFVLVAGENWWRTHGLKLGDTLPLNTPLTEQAAAQIVAHAQARHNRSLTTAQ